VQRNGSQLNNQTQRPPPNSYSQTLDGPPGSYFANAQSKYGQVHASRSTPVTPTPQLLAKSPGPDRLRMDPRSHSPGPVRRSVTPKESDFYQVQSPAPQRSQMSRSEPQISQGQSPVYINHPSSSQTSDNSYENIPGGYYYSSAPQNVSYEPNRVMDSLSRSYEFPPTQPTYSDDYRPSNKYPQQQPRSSGQYPPQTNPPSSQKQYHNRQQPIQGQHPGQGHYQNMSQGSRSQTPSKASMRDPSPQGPRNLRPSQPNPVPQLTTHRATPTQPSHPSYHGPPNVHPQGHSNQGHSYAQGSQNHPPGYNAPPPYDRRTSYADNRDTNPPRDPRDQYYRK